MLLVSIAAHFFESELTHPCERASEEARVACRVCTRVVAAVPVLLWNRWRILERDWRLHRVKECGGCSREKKELHRCWIASLKVRKLMVEGLWERGGGGGGEREMVVVVVVVAATCVFGAAILDFVAFLFSR